MSPVPPVFHAVVAVSIGPLSNFNSITHQPFYLGKQDWFKGEFQIEDISANFGTGRDGKHRWGEATETVGN